MADYKQIVEAKRKEMLDILLESIENNPTRWERGWVSIDVPFNGLTLKNYNGINALFLDAVAHRRGYKDTRWATFNQLKSLGASVKAGERASEVFYWSNYDVKTKKPFDERKIEGLTVEERRQYLKENVKPILKFFHVFNAEQCNNFPENTRKSLITEEERDAQNALIETVINNSEAPVKYDGGDKAYYRPSEDTIHLPQISTFKTITNYYATALHEIGHSTGHPNRLNRDIANQFGSAAYAIEELRAELASVFMQTELGIHLRNAEIANHGAYLQSWLLAVKSDPTAFYKAASDASKIADYLKERYLEAQNANSKEKAPVAKIEWSEYNKLNKFANREMGIGELDRLIADTYNEINLKEVLGFYKTKFSIVGYDENGEKQEYEGRIDSDENCGIIEHIQKSAQFDLENPSIFAWEQDKKKRTAAIEDVKKSRTWILYDFVPYLKKWAGIARQVKIDESLHKIEQTQVAEENSSQHVNGEESLVKEVDMKENNQQQVDQYNKLSVEQDGDDYNISYTTIPWSVSTANFPKDVRSAAIWLIKNNHQDEESVRAAFFYRLTSMTSDDIRAVEKDNARILSIYQKFNNKKEENLKVEQNVHTRVSNESVEYADFDSVFYDYQKNRFDVLDSCGGEFALLFSPKVGYYAIRMDERILETQKRLKSVYRKYDSPVQYDLKKIYGLPMKDVQEVKDLWKEIKYNVESEALHQKDRNEIFARGVRAKAKGWKEVQSISFSVNEKTKDMEIKDVDSGELFKIHSSDNIDFLKMGDAERRSYADAWAQQYNFNFGKAEDAKVIADCQMLAFRNLQNILDNTPKEKLSENLTRELYNSMLREENAIKENEDSTTAQVESLVLLGYMEMNKVPFYIDDQLFGHCEDLDYDYLSVNSRFMAYGETRKKVLETNMRNQAKGFLDKNKAQVYVVSRDNNAVADETVSLLDSEEFNLRGERFREKVTNRTMYEIIVQPKNSLNGLREQSLGCCLESDVDRILGHEVKSDWGDKLDHFSFKSRQRGQNAKNQNVSE